MVTTSRANWPSWASDVRASVGWLVAALVLLGCREKQPSRQGPGASATDASAQPDDVADMVLVPAGELDMGCGPDIASSCNAEELPEHRVALDAFWIDRTEVTQSAYARCVRAGVCKVPVSGFDPERQPQHPVVYVNWQHARTYCQWRGRRLPTEAEWEKAARGTDGRAFPWGNEAATCALAYYTRCEEPFPAVGSRPAGKSPFGALDMAGSVEEWVADWYGGDTYAKSPPRDPRGPEMGTQRVLRGGAYDPWHIRATARSFMFPDEVDAVVGFRCAREHVGTGRR